MYETFTNANGVSSWPLPRRLFDRISDLAFVEDEAHAGQHPLLIPGFFARFREPMKA